MKILSYLKLLWVQVLIAALLGVVVGLLWPHTGEAMRPLGDAFIKVVRMIIAPVVFCTVVIGIAHMSDMKKFGRVGGKTLIYFETVSTLALAIGLFVGNVVRPGAGFNVNATEADKGMVAQFAKSAANDSLVDHLMKIIPDTLFSPFITGDLLQVLFIAILTGFACSRLGAFGAKAAHALEEVTKVLFSIIGIIVWAASLGAFGAMAFTIGRYGVAALQPLAFLIATFYLTSFLFVVLVLGTIARLAGFSIFRYMRYIREELLIVLGTSSSEPVLPQLIMKSQKLGASRSVVGLVIPTGYSFNLDGTNIYMTLAILFLAQATNTDLSFGQQLEILAIAMLTSKGASGVTGAGFITLAATLTIVPAIPIESLAVLVGIDRFMSQCRALTNAIGNGVATLVVAQWENELDREALMRELNAGPSGPVAAPSGELRPAHEAA